jgi:hypothetical protein
MKDQHVIEELSAYIDGEATEPTRIERHLQSCEACASRHMELQKLSTHVSRLSAPEENPQFFENVMAAVARDEQHSVVRFADWKSRFVPLAIAALLLLCVGFALTIPGPQEAVQITTVILPADIDHADEAAILAEIERFLDEGLDLGLFESEAELEEEVVDSVTIETMLAVLEDDLLRGEAYAVLDNDEHVYITDDFYGMMDEMSNEEFDELGELLIAFNE